MWFQRHGDCPNPDCSGGIRFDACEFICRKCGSRFSFEEIFPKLDRKTQNDIAWDYDLMDDTFDQS